MDFDDAFAVLDDRARVELAVDAAEMAVALLPEGLPGREDAATAAASVRAWLDSGEVAVVEPARHVTYQPRAGTQGWYAGQAASWAAEAAYSAGLNAAGDVTTPQHRVPVAAAGAVFSASSAGVPDRRLWELVAARFVSGAAVQVWATLATDGWERSVEDLTAAAETLAD